METISSFFSTYFFDQVDLNIFQFSSFCFVSFLGSLLTTAAGIGGGTLVLATMALFLPPTILIPLHAAIQLGSNLGRTLLMLNHISVSIIPSFMIGSILGVIVGGQIFISLHLSLLQGFLAIFIMYSVWNTRPSPQGSGKTRFFWVGVISSFLTMFIGATGPLVAPLVAAECKTRQEVVSTHATLMTIQHSLKLFSFGLLGISIGPYVPILAAMLAFGFLGTYFGKLLLNKLPEIFFRTVLKYLITILAIRLMYQAILGS